MPSVFRFASMFPMRFVLSFVFLRLLAFRLRSSHLVSVSSYCSVELFSSDVTMIFSRQTRAHRSVSEARIVLEAITLSRSMYAVYITINNISQTDRCSKVMKWHISFIFHYITYRIDLLAINVFIEWLEIKLRQF